MAYLSLSKAAKYINDQIDGAAIDAEDLLRYGSQGHILITASFSGEMYNPMTQVNEDYLGQLVIPPRHLLEMDIEGRTRIQVAHSLDGRVMYFPQAERTRDQLSITISELDELIRHITNTKQYQNIEVSNDINSGTVATKNTQCGTTINKIRKNSLDAPIREAIKRANSNVTAEVYLKLREMALDEVSPFTGATEKDALCYTKDDGTMSKLSKNALHKRIAKLYQPLSAPKRH